MIFAPFAYKQTVAQQVAATVYVPRYDIYSGSVYLAMPGTRFTNGSGSVPLNMTNYYDDISANIKGTGTNLEVKPTGSGVTAQLYASASVLDSGSFNWTGSGYSTSIFSAGDQNVGYYATSTFPFGTTTVANFVVETWFNRTGTFSNPPFNMFVFGEYTGDYILLDMNSSNFRYFVGGNQLSTANGNSTNIWYHLAYVKSGTTRNIYLNGNRIATDTLATGMGTSPYWEVLGGNGNNDGAGKRVNDYRITVGSDRGYTGTNILVPASLVRPANSYDTAVNNWADVTGITSTSILDAVNTFVNTCKTDGTWNKLVSVYPFITDSTNSTRAKLQFRYNLKNPAIYRASYLNNNSSGGTGGWTNASSDTFNLNISPNTLGANYTIGFYTNSDAAATDQIDMGVYDGGGEYVYVIAGRNKSGANAQILMAPSSAQIVYNVTGTGPFTGLFGTAGNSTTGYAYRRTTQLGTGNYTNTSRGDANNFGLGSFFQTSNTAVSPTTKTYQFAFTAEYLNSTEFGNLATAVNTLQGSLDTIYGTSRKAYT